MELVYLLNEEGYGALAGELLTEISLGYELGNEYDEPNISAYSFERSTGPEESQRKPVPEDEQLKFAVEFLQLRLVAPMRFLAEAEEIAGELVTTIEGTPQSESGHGKSNGPIRIAFNPPANRSETRIQRVEAPGSYESIDELSLALKSLAVEGN